MKHNRSLQLLVFPISLIVTHSQAASTNPIRKETWKAACAVAADLQKVQKRAAQMLKHKIGGVAQYLAQAYKTKIYIEMKKSGEYRKVDLVLIEYYMTKANSNQKAAQRTTVTIAATAIAHAAKFEGAIQEFVNMANQIAEDGAHACLIEGKYAWKISGGSQTAMRKKAVSQKHPP
ncbi:hypothetical protein, unlikely [Trypanosoma brucei gambiense DAL972]|uniref:Trypanosome variant surface glycoprotein A-type N-terminal domain-containing protein n=1 Tax=Trypanosoma brucei gambiense (strain MHOM/CI/86/DAL972) TaxID=679716 RepID=C9ZQ17_TRYB9|nr:hypothetical protein, unlikely [Trypanosoma brucei gambiense DAL972]CBH11495.1 hypothetical protein, unlikely [Trypanosoma brucei gambiense DAL972]|eukprot:XP_011773782.1 hypothetical protein, unlikely [Trypanosoma brucei gambiense DAL972]